MIKNKQLFAKLILMGWFFPTRSKNLLFSPTKYSIQLKLIANNKNTFLIYEIPNKPCLDLNSFPISSEYTASEVIEYINNIHTE